MKVNIVMVEPEIPQNTGNIARTCAATGCKLHLVKPLGFEITDKYLKRAGLDYWDKLEIEEHESLEKFLENARGAIKQQLSDEKFRYEKYLKEKEKEASEENSDKQNIQSS